jgi:hypothetical protein
MGFAEGKMAQASACLVPFQMGTLLGHILFKAL